MRVNNHDRRFGADPFYIFAVVDGQPLLLTEEDVERAARRAEANREDLPTTPARIRYAIRRLFVG